jgi:hypothetical protein
MTDFYRHEEYARRDDSSPRQPGTKKEEISDNPDEAKKKYQKENVVSESVN